MIEHDQLNERAGFLRRFPLRGAFAGAQTDDSATDADAFAGLQRYIADEAVALVEQAEDGLARLHRCHPGIGIVRACGHTRFGDRAIVGGRRRSFRCLAVAAGGRQQCEAGQRDDGKSRSHAASGVHA